MTTTIGRRAFGALGFAAALAASARGARAQAGGPIKIGVLHSLSGTMAISETTLKDVMLMLIDAQNKPRAACSATSSRPSSWTRPPTGRYSPKRPVS